MQTHEKAQKSMHAESLESEVIDDKLFLPEVPPGRRLLHVDLDGAWPREVLPEAGYLDCRSWGPSLRYSATRRGIEDFHSFVSSHPADFRLYGSGDFHHLSALWLRSIREPFTLVSFDNHPDWDIRPPHWCCGTWVNRALALPQTARAVVWGCGNFELNFPGSLFANHRALRSGRLEVWPWTERLKPATRLRWPGLQPENWRERFVDFVGTLAAERVYVTVDLDCLRVEEATTNWESGLFSAADIAWALEQLRAGAELVGGDVCGAYSPPEYARLKQRIESGLDHPRQPEVDCAQAKARNTQALSTIWPALTGGDKESAHAEQRDAQHQIPG